MDTISVVINTENEQENLPRALASVKDFADEIIVVDMESSDKTLQIAQEAGAMVYSHKKTGYVEPARNFAISKASKDWVFILDSDEEISKSLSSKIKVILTKKSADYFRIPRKNIVFGKWMKHSRWWPDLNIRLFRKGSVLWNEIIHSVPLTKGKGEDFPEKEEFAIIHHNYNSIEQFLERMNRYTNFQKENLIKNKHKFLWRDLIRFPLKEFLGRYFSGEGYKDGLHGLAASLLQAFSEFILYLKVWQSEKFLEQSISISEVEKESRSVVKEIYWWICESYKKEKGIIARIPAKILQKYLSHND